MKSRIFYLILVICHSEITFAEFKDKGFLVSAYLGGTTSVVNFKSLPIVSETDSLSNPTNPKDFTFGFGLGYHFKPPTPLKSLVYDMSVNLDEYYFQMKPSGTVYQYQMIEYDNFAYSTSINSLRLLINHEWILNPIATYFYPLIEGGIGFAYNTMSYRDSPLISGYTEGRNITTGSNYQFVYSGGAGVKIMIPKKSMALSIRYLYASLGNSQTSSSGSVPLTSPLKAKIATNTWVAGLNYYL
ncbi:MAG: outer membrane beta-barrel protein [Legionellaceae bacterium]|nr:outer membrane beta-barrel protein [Legionellaceae bacterium]